MRPTRQQRHLRAWLRRYLPAPVDDDDCHLWAMWHAHARMDGPLWRFASPGRRMRYARQYRDRARQP